MMEKNHAHSLPLAEAVIRLQAEDSVGIAKFPLAAGTELLPTDGYGQGKIRVSQDVPAGHKLSLLTIPAGSQVLRYGYKIGVATRTIEPGEWVHSHNLDVGPMERDFEIQVWRGCEAAAPSQAGRTFDGFAREDGRAGTRNYIAVISTVSCSAQCARLIAEWFTSERLKEFPQVDGVVAITHQTGCGIPEEGLAYRYLQNFLLGLARHPNVSQALFVSLGCEVMQIQKALEQAAVEGTFQGSQPPVLVIEALGGIEKTVRCGIERVTEMLSRANTCRRTPLPLAGLKIALQCGGSDGWSGVTANPLVGRVSDEVVYQGGTVVLAETPEIYGAEQLLTRRVATPEVGQKLIRHIQWWQKMAEMLQFSLDNNPTPGNKAGGLTTIFEKSLGAVSKAGSTPLMDVYEYAAEVRTPGLVFMDSPGYDTVSVAGEVAGGCNLVMFTSGRGSVFGGSLAPCLKIASNSDLYARMEPDMDFNAGRLLEGDPMDLLAENLLDQVILTASGRRSKSEQKGCREAEYIPWQPGTRI